MLWFIGLGISGISELSDSTLEVIKNAEIVYLESFTSPISESEKKQLEDISGGEFKTAKRWLVEDGNEILENAKNRETVLISYGDPYIATTHLELKTRAIRDVSKVGPVSDKGIYDMSKSFAESVGKGEIQAKHGSEETKTSSKSPRVRSALARARASSAC